MKTPHIFPVFVFNINPTQVRSLGLTDDASYIVSGGEDAVVTVWPVDQVIESRADQGPLREFHSWAVHSLAVTSLHVGRGGVRGRVYSASLDCTARVFEIFSRQLLLTVSCGAFLSAVTVAIDESRLYLGSGGDGTILVVELEAGGGAQGGGGGGGGPRVEGRLVGHSLPVTGLALLGLDGTLVSTSEDGTLKTWDVASSACVQTTDLKEPLHCLALAPTGQKNPSDHDVAPFVGLKKWGASAVSAPGPQDLAPLRRPLSQDDSCDPTARNLKRVR